MIAFRGPRGLQMVGQSIGMTLVDTRFKLMSFHEALRFLAIRGGLTLTDARESCRLRMVGRILSSKCARPTSA